MRLSIQVGSTHTILLFENEAQLLSFVTDVYYNRTTPVKVRTVHGADWYIRPSSVDMYKQL